MRVLSRLEPYLQRSRAALGWLPRQLHKPLAQKIAAAELVSFDVFDTLVTRPLSRPRAVFDLTAPRAERLLAERASLRLSPGAFGALREQAGRQAAEAARERGGEEYDLRAVYTLLCERAGAPPELAAELQQLEEEIELAIQRPRESGRLAFEEARRQNKRIILISDSFLDAALVAQIVQRCGYSGYHQLYVSSAHDALKRSGRLYERIRELEGRPPRWLHIGDDQLADIRVPARLGIRTHHLPNPGQLYLQDPWLAELWERAEVGASLGSALQHGVSSRKFYDRAPAVRRRARFAGSAYRLGYEAGGPLLLAFTAWLVEKARRDGITDLYFLARDGYLPQRIYQLLEAGRTGAPRAHYLYASRRAYSVAALRSPRDIIASLELKSGAVKLADLLQNRFGIAPQQLAAGSLRASGFVGLDDVIALRELPQRQRLERLLIANAAPILRRAEEERSALLAYLREQGLFDATRRSALVDLGHNGSLQHALSQLVGRDDLRGYYFATFAPARERVQQGLSLSSYLLEFEDSLCSEHVYCRNLAVFELLFLPPLPSLEHMQRAPDGVLSPVFVQGDESARFEVSRELQRGVLDFCEDIARASAGQPWLFSISKQDALRTFAAYAGRPERQDAALLEGVSFVDAFGGFNTRYLIASPLFPALDAANFPAYEAASWWKAGARAAAGQAGAGSPRGRSHWRRKLRKLWRDPRRFLADAGLSRSLRELRAVLARRR